MKIGTREIGPGQPCAIIAELSNNHNGELYRALRLMEAAKAAGADLIKLQAYTPDELVHLRGDGPAPGPWGSQGFTMRTLYEKAQTPLKWMATLFAEGRAMEIPVFASVFGKESLAVLEDVGCPAYKISHLDCANDDLAKLVMATKKPVIVSQSAPLSRVSTYYWKSNVIRMLCPGGYPTQAGDMHLRQQFLWEPWGLSSHCRDPFATVTAVARGASIVEVHFHLDSEPSELEANVSYHEAEFAAMVGMVRHTETILG